MKCVENLTVEPLFFFFIIIFSYVSLLVSVKFQLKLNFNV